jgi:hypothetical protein
LAQGERLRAFVLLVGPFYLLYLADLAGSLLGGLRFMAPGFFLLAFLILVMKAKGSILQGFLVTSSWQKG